MAIKQMQAGARPAAGREQNSRKDLARYTPIDLKLHAALDTAFVAAGLIAPWAFGFSHLTGATFYSLALTLFGLGVNLITDYPLGLLKALPFKWHRLAEWLSPPPFIIVPWLFFSDAGAMPSVLTVIGIGILLNTALTRPDLRDEKTE